MSNVLDPNVKESIETETPNYITKEEFNKSLNSAISSHLKRLDFGKQISEAIEGSLRERQANVEPKSETTTTASSEMVLLQKKLEAMEKQMKVKEEALMSREKKAREKDALTTIKHELTSMGVRPEAVDHLSKVLKAEDRIKFDDDGNIQFASDNEELQDLKSGLKEYLDPKKNPAIALYLPPKTVSKTISKPVAPPFPNSLNTQERALTDRQKAENVKARLDVLGIKI